ncbi:MAG: ATP-binding protein [Methanosarcinales archaeon]|nr:ATP-binding protein [Methanosarcinales archaeon]
MNDISPELKREWIVRALGKAGFEEMPAPGIFAKKYGNDKILVDLNEKQPCAIFIIGKARVAVDDSNGTLLSINQIIVDAEGGVMPEEDEQKGMPEQPDDAQTGAKPVPTEQVNVPAVPEAPQALTPSNNLLDLIQKYVGNDVMQVFGDTGTCKSKFALEVAREAIAAGKKVYYLDTERNLTTEDIDSLNGCEYKYTPVLDEIDKIVQNLPAVDVVILDSIGFPVLTSYARLSMKQKGDALLKLIAIFGDLKIWAYRNNGVAVVTNQPESEFGKDKGHIFRPFGDKSQFACKEIWKTEFEHRSPTETKVSIKSFRSRSMGQRTKIASLKITDAGVEVIT